MELIEKALAKARREGVIGQSEARPQEPAETGRQPAGGGWTRQITDILYSRTRTVERKPEQWELNRLVSADRNSKSADIFRLLRTKVLLPMRENGWRTLAVVGPTAGVGKTTIASNLAVSIALDGNQTVLLVDIDLRRPSVAKYFGISPAHGLADCLEGKASVEEVLVNPGIERLVILPSTGTRQNSTELVGSAAMGTLLEDLRNRYESRIVIFDMPPLLLSSDALVLLKRFDAVLLVVEDGGSTREQLLQSREMLGSSNLLGWVLNKGRLDEQGYYY